MSGLRQNFHRKPAQSKKKRLFHFICFFSVVCLRSHFNSFLLHRYALTQFSEFLCLGCFFTPFTDKKTSIEYQNWTVQKKKSSSDTYYIVSFLAFVISFAKHNASKKYIYFLQAKRLFLDSSININVFKFPFVSPVTQGKTKPQIQKSPAEIFILLSHFHPLYKSCIFIFSIV